MYQPATLAHQAVVSGQFSNWLLRRAVLLHSRDRAHKQVELCCYLKFFYVPLWCCIKGAGGGAVERHEAGERVQLLGVFIVKFILFWHCAGGAGTSGAKHGAVAELAQVLGVYEVGACAWHPVDARNTLLRTHAHTYIHQPCTTQMLQM
jgi:hypothetical protein